MNVLLVAGGDPSHWPAFSQPFDQIIGIDRGNLFLLRRGIVPDMAIGDFDSLTEDEKKEVFDWSNWRTLGSSAGKPMVRSGTTFFAFFISNKDRG